jgi:hypothetical protein
MNNFPVVSVRDITTQAKMNAWKLAVASGEVFSALGDPNDNSGGIVRFVTENGYLMARFVDGVMYIISPIDGVGTTNVRIGDGTPNPAAGNGVFGPLSTVISPPTGFVGVPNDYILTQIGKYAFSETGLTGVVIPTTVTQIDNYAFAFSNFNETFATLTFDEGNSYEGSQCETINAYAFRHAGFREVTIPHSVTSIGQSAFRWNSLLKDVTLPASTVMAAPAFRYMDSLPVVKVVTVWFPTFYAWRLTNTQNFSSRDGSVVTLLAYFGGMPLADYLLYGLCPDAFDLDSEMIANIAAAEAEAAGANAAAIEEAVETALAEAAAADAVAAAAEAAEAAAAVVAATTIQHLFSSGEPGNEITWSRKYSFVSFPIFDGMVQQLQEERHIAALEHSKLAMRQTRNQRYAEMTRARSRINHLYASQTDRVTNYNTHNYLHLDSDGNNMNTGNSPGLGIGPGIGPFAPLPEVLSSNTVTTFQALPPMPTSLYNGFLIPSLVTTVDSTVATYCGCGPPTTEPGILVIDPAT